MEEMYKFLIGTFVLFLGIPIGSFLARLTKEELREGQKWFKLIIFASLTGALISLFLKNDALLFTFLFIMIATSRSLFSRK